jgi:threonine dehydratase
MVRELAREDRIVAIRVLINDRPGVLGTIAATIGEKGGNILEVLHHRTMLKVPPKGASVDLTIETHGPEHAGEIERAVAAKGYRVERLDPPSPQE